MPVLTARWQGDLSLLLIVLLALLPVVLPQMVTDPPEGSGTTTTDAPEASDPSYFYDRSTATSSVVPGASGYVTIPLDVPYFICGEAYDQLQFNTPGSFTDQPYTLGNGVSTCRSILNGNPSSLIGTIIRPVSGSVTISYVISYRWDTGAVKDATFLKAVADGLVSSIDDIAYVVVVTVDDRADGGNYYQVALVADYVTFRFTFIVHFGPISSSISGGSFIGYCCSGISETIGLISQVRNTIRPIVSFPSVVSNVNPPDQTDATAKYQCRVWLLDGKTPSPQFHKCPATDDQASKDARATEVSSTCYDIDQDATLASGHTARCCYDSSPEQLFAATEGLMYTADADITARSNCMQGGLNAEYLVLRPRPTSSQYQAPTTSSCSGDPFIRTLDGQLYICSPVGYFRLFIYGNAIVDARFVARGDPAVGASAIDAVAARNGTGTVVFELDGQGGITITVSLGGQSRVILDSQFVNGVISVFGVTITQLPAVGITPAGYIAKFTGSNFQVLVRAWMNAFTSFLEALVLADSSLLGSGTRGMTGPFDGSTANDLQNPSGQSISPDSSGRQILEEMCNTWKLAAENPFFVDGDVGPSTIFTETQEFPDHVSFVCDETTIDPGAVATCEQSSICECTHTALGPEAGALTLAALKDLNATIATFANSPPTALGPSVLSVEVGVTRSFFYTGEDPDGDMVTLELMNGPTSGASFDLSTSPPGMVLTWTPADRNEINAMSVVPMDSTGSTGIAIPITIKLCDNGGNGNCRPDALLPDSSPTDRFQLVASTCDPGYQGSHCDFDFNGCATGTHQCLDDASCTDASPAVQAMSNYTYTCTECADGADLVVDQCVDVDECMTTMPCNQICINEFAGFNCECNPGYIAFNDTYCEDIDECADGTDSCEQECSNTEGSFVCDCFTGYTFMTDMCEPNGDTIALCDNTANGGCDRMTTICGAVNDSLVSCSCRPGYEVMSGSMDECQPIDECTSTTAPHMCRSTPTTATCVDTTPGYNCTCDPGFTLEADMRGCEACPTNRWGVNCMGFCVCADPSACDPATGCPACAAGYTGGSCDVDIDECLIVDRCPDNSMCINTNGSSLCPCDTNYIYNATTQMCDLMDACAGNPCTSGTCVQQGTTFNYICNCIPGYTGTLCDVDIDDCDTNPCQNMAACNDAIDGFICDCTPGFMGNTCDAPIPTTTTAPPPPTEDFIGQFTVGCVIPADTNTPGYTAFITGLQNAITSAVEDRVGVDATTVISNVNPETKQVMFVVSVPSSANLTFVVILDAVAAGLTASTNLRCPDSTPLVIAADSISVGGVPAVPQATPSQLPLILGVVLGILFLVLLTVLIAFCSKRVFRAPPVLVGRRLVQPPSAMYGGHQGPSMRWLPTRLVNAAGLSAIQPRTRPVDNPWAVDPSELYADNEAPSNAWRGLDNAYYGRTYLRPTPGGNLPAFQAPPSTSIPTPGGGGLMFRNISGAGGQTGGQGLGLRRMGPFSRPSWPAMPRLPAMPRMPAMRLPSMPGLPSIPFFRRQPPVGPPAPGQIYASPMAMAGPAVPFATGSQMLPMRSIAIGPSRPPPAPNFSWQAASGF